MSAVNPTTLILADQELTSSDVKHIVSLEANPAPTYHVLIPADTERNMFVALLNSLYVGGVGEAWEVLTEPEPNTAEATATAQEQLDTTIALFAAAGAASDGEITADDPLPALRKAAADPLRDVQNIIVVTYPLAVEDTFRQDWASKARETLEIPVLHIYRGTSSLG